MTRRRPVSTLLIAAGIVVLLTILFVNVPVSGLFGYRFQVNRAPILEAYLYLAGAIGILLIGLGYASSRIKSDTFDGVGLFVFLLAGLVIADRLLLVHYGLPRHTYDAEKRYEQRESWSRVLSKRFDNKLNETNSYGHHDHEFPVAKPPGEFRTVMLGDSVTMGYGVTRDETHANQLEQLIAEGRPPGCSVQIINTGVGGYTTFQERLVLKESLVFAPDLITVGFVMNDVRESMRRYRVAPGEGTPYRGLRMMAEDLVGVFRTETGFGQLAEELAQPFQRRFQVEAMRHVQVTEEMARDDGTDPYYRKAWDNSLEDLEAIYDTAKRNDIPVLLLIFPFTFQILDEATEGPQERLIAHAEAQGVPYIDFTEIFEDLILRDGEHDELAERQHVDLAKLMPMYRDRFDVYFLDSDHLTVEGHRVVAEHLFDYLKRSKLIDPQRLGCPSSS